MFLPKAENVLIVVIDIDKSRFPPRITDHTLEAPPDGETPVKNIPSCISTLFGNSNIPKKKLSCHKKYKNNQN